MKKKITILFMFGLMVFQSTKACDVCGCGASLNGAGLLTNYRFNSIYLGYHIANYTGDPTHGDGSIDRFNTVELNLRYYLSNRFTLQAALPYRINHRWIQDEKQSLTGLSDARLLLGYVLLRDYNVSESTTLFVESSIGSQAPTGAYNKDIHDQDLPENFNVGRGSWAMIQQNNIVLSNQYLGAIVSTNLLLSGRSPGGYSYGNQFSLQILGYWEKRLSGIFSITPKLGIYSEKVQNDLYAKDVKVPGTGGHGVYVTYGGNVRIDRFQLGFAFSNALSQSYSDNELEAGIRMSAQIGYNF